MTASKSVRLTAQSIAKAMAELPPGGRRDMADPDCRGLVLRLSVGSQSWVLQCRDREGRKRRFPVGAYPTMGLAAARTAARTLHAKIRQDDWVDPIAKRRADRAMGTAAREGIGTLAALLDAYGAAKHVAAQKAWPHSRKRIERVFKPLLGRPMAALTIADMQTEANRYAAAQSAAFAVRTVNPALKWGRTNGYGLRDAGSLTQPVAVARRKRVLDREELARLLPVLTASSRPYAACMRFILLTLARREEAAGARWRDVDLTAGTWTIHETKNGEPHTVPLSNQALDLLRSLRSDGAQPDGLVFATSTGRPLASWTFETVAVQKASNTEGWHRHDLRRTAATLLGEMGETPDIIEAALNHVHIRSPIAALYNRSRYRPQVAAALQRLADALDGIAAGGAEIIPLRARDAG